MKSLRIALSDIVSHAFAACGFDRVDGEVVLSDRPDLGQFQCNGALSAARRAKANPREIARQVVDVLAASPVLHEASLAGPGFINLTVSDALLVEHVRAQAADDRLGCEKTANPFRMIIDYGGANIAKPLHVGHLRSAIIGESLKRLARFLGHEVLGDVHLGDWGLQMGMVLSEIERRRPDLPYFDPGHAGPYPEVSPVTVFDLDQIYPVASERAKTDPAAMEQARQATFALQQGHPGYRALWNHVREVSVAALKSDYSRLNIDFDLWLGESDTQDHIPSMIDRLQADGWAIESEGAWVIPVKEPSDMKEIPPLVLLKSDGAALYTTTDLATIEQRVQDFKPDCMLYVVDGRQSDHFT